MNFSLAIIFSFAAFFLSKNKISNKFSSIKTLSSLPIYFGYNAFASTLIINIFLIISFNFILIDKELLQTLIVLFINLSFLALLYKQDFNKDFKAREKFESKFLTLLKISAAFSIIVTIAIVASIFFESINFFKEISIIDFLFGTSWHPKDSAAGADSFGAVPLFLGTFLIMIIAMLVAVPLGIISASYLAEYANPHFRKYAKAILEILAGVPTVVYGYFAAFSVAPLIKDIATKIGLDAASESALAAGLVMGIMIIPFVLSLSDDVMRSVPKKLREASLGLGATKSETTLKVVLPAALPGIIGAVLLAISRAIGETMIVTMAAGLAANMTINPLQSVTTATAQIVTLLIGDQEFDSLKTLSAFALGLMLFFVTFILNLIALITVKKYHEQYD